MICNHQTLIPFDTIDTIDTFDTIDYTLIKKSNRLTHLYMKEKTVCIFFQSQIPPNNSNIPQSSFIHFIMIVQSYYRLTASTTPLKGVKD